MTVTAPTPAAARTKPPEVLHMLHAGASSSVPMRLARFPQFPPHY